MNHENYQEEKPSVTGLASVALSELEEEVLRVLQTAPDAGMTADQIEKQLNDENITEAQIDQVLDELRAKGFTEPAEPWRRNHSVN